MDKDHQYENLESEYTCYILEQLTGNRTEMQKNLCR